MEPLLDEMHHPSRERLIEEIAQRVEQRIVMNNSLVERFEERLSHRALRWIVLNVTVLLAGVGAMLGMFYSMNARIETSAQMLTLHAKLLEAHGAAADTYRREMIMEIHEIRANQDEMNRFLRSLHKPLK